MDSQRAKQRLLDLQAELTQLAGTRRSGADVVQLDQAAVGRLSRMDAMQAQEMNKATAARAELELRRIDAALARIESGDYGLCVDCDEPIAEGRLEANPTMTLCVSCASAREK
ncbi:MAG: TraR/DksA C4-type zinc finger protein [Gammaproteobacteria bacterium]